MRSTPFISKGSEADMQLLVGSIFTRHRQQVYQLAWKVTRSPELANDIVQEVFMKLWEHRDNLGDIEVMEAWLHRVVKNKLIDFLRKTAADDRMKAALLTRYQQAKQYNADQQLEGKQCESSLHEAIEQLPSQRKLVYRLNRESGLSYQEIANELSISPHTVKNQLFLAIRFLQKKFSFQ